MNQELQLPEKNQEQRRNKKIIHLSSKRECLLHTAMTSLFYYPADVCSKWIINFVSHIFLFLMEMSPWGILAPYFPLHIPGKCFPHIFLIIILVLKGIGRLNKHVKSRLNIWMTGRRRKRRKRRKLGKSCVCRSNNAIYIL